MLNYYHRTTSFSEILNSYEFERNLEFEKNFKKDMALLERTLVGLSEDAKPIIYVIPCFSSDPKLIFIDQKSYNIFFTFFEFVEMESFKLKDLILRKEFEDLKYSELPGPKRRLISNCPFILTMFDKDKLEETEKEKLKKLLI